MIRAPGLGQGLASCKCLTNTGALVATGAPRQLQGSVTKLCCPDRPPHTHGLPCLWHSGPCAALAAPPQSYPPPAAPTLALRFPFSSSKPSGILPSGIPGHQQWDFLPLCLFSGLSRPVPGNLALPYISLRASLWLPLSLPWPGA